MSYCMTFGLANSVQWLKTVKRKHCRWPCLVWLLQIMAGSLSKLRETSGRGSVITCRPSN